MQRPRRLTCCCCGESTTGRQWWNRDTGYGICLPCAEKIAAREGWAEVEKLAGKRGVHFDLPERKEQAGVIGVRLASNGAIVLARHTQYGPSAVTYANLTQAGNAADKLRAVGIDCSVIGRRPFYVRIDDAERVPVLN